MNVNLNNNVTPNVIKKKVIILNVSAGIIANAEIIANVVVKIKLNRKKAIIPTANVSIVNVGIIVNAEVKKNP